MDDEVYVHDKLYPSLGTSVEEQNPLARPRTVVPMPAFTDPNNPTAQSGSVNFSMDKHPVAHADDYGQDIEQEFGAVDVRTAQDAHTETIEGSAAAPDDRSQWTKDHWQAVAEGYGLPKSGRTDEVQKRVEDFERDNNIEA